LGLKWEALNKIYETASLIWYNLGHTESSCLKSPIKWWKKNFEDEDIEEDNNLQKTLSTNLSISQVIDLSLLAFLATNNILFESTTNRLAFYERDCDLDNMDYDPINLAQQIVNEENSEISNDSYN
ncbi:14180_t:CDS:2, partial [Dentiscutata erythropus]